MCAISGVVWRDSARPAAVDLVEAMNAAQLHRGPDDGGVFSDGAVALGHRRLSIIDLSSAGHQPMCSADGRLAIVFNGEIYNYVELRNELRGLGHDFRTETDTEVLLQAFAAWGPDCLDRLVGMWAFAIHDRSNQSVFLSRDRLGIKPLCWLEGPKQFAFASEAKALVTAFPERRRENRETIARFLPSGQLCDSDATFFDGIQVLPPGHNGSWNIASGRFRTWRYWELPRPEETNGTVEEFDTLLQDAVRLRLRSDVPVGTCLSGGIDSSTLVAIAGELHPEPIRTYSGLYPDPHADESRFVDAVSRSTHSRNHGVRPTPGAELLDELREITWHQDQPSAGPGLYTQYHVMRRAAENVTVILDGQGGDELLAGYIPYFTPHLADLVSGGHWWTALKTLAGVHQHWGLAHVAGLPGRLAGARIKRAAQAVGVRRPARVQSERILHGAMPDPMSSESTLADPIGRGSQLDAVLARDVLVTSLPALLHYEDRNSMAYSLEARVPLLDHRLVELAFRLPAAAKIRGTWTKWALRCAAEKRLPAEVAWRRSKMGYPTPFARWLRQPEIAARFQQLLASKELAEREIIDPGQLERIWREHQSGRDHAWMIWRIATLELWFRAFVDRLDPSPAVRGSAP